MIAGLPQTLAAFAIILSALVRLIRSGASWQAIDDGEARIDHLRELTGITRLDALLEAFGPPRMDGVWPVTRASVRSHRTGLGYLIGDRWMDMACIAVASMALIPIWPLWGPGTSTWLDTLLAFAGFYQLAGWAASTRLVGQR